MQGRRQSESKGAPPGERHSLRWCMLGTEGARRREKLHVLTCGALKWDSPHLAGAPLDIAELDFFFLFRDADALNSRTR